MVAIEEVSFPSERANQFVDLSWNIYPGKHVWIPPVKDGIHANFDRNMSFYSHGDAQPFVALDGDEVVGRIVASYDEQLIGGGDIGHMGFFECVDDSAVAKALLGAAEDWLKSKGKTKVVGPVNLNIFRGYRIQVKGFDLRPYFSEPRTPEYYVTLLESAGYGRSDLWHTWDLPAMVFPMMEQFLRGSLEKYDQSYLESFEFRPIRTDNFLEVCAIMRPIVMDTYWDNFGCTDMGEAEYLQTQGGMGFLANKHSYIIHAADGEPAGFVWGFYDYAEAFIEMDGDLANWSAVENATCPYGVWHSIGIKKEFRGAGLLSYAALRTLLTCKELGLDAVVAALVKDGPSVYDGFGPAPRSYAVFSKDI